MVVISLVLFFLPLINGLIGGAVGGYMAGSVRRGLTAAILPAIIVAAGLFVLLLLFEAPLAGFFVGLAGGVVVLLADVGLFLGAAIGGAIAQSGTRRLPA
jgi:hypothetical protein